MRLRPTQPFKMEIKEKILNSLKDGVIQKPINEAVKEANDLMNEGMDIFQATNHITFFTCKTKEEALKLLYKYRVEHKN